MNLLILNLISEIFKLSNVETQIYRFVTLIVIIIFSITLWTTFIGKRIEDSANESQQQNLAQAAKDIQELLAQLDETYPSDTTMDRMKIATEVITQIDNNKTKAERILSAIKSGGVAAVEQLLNHPASSFVITALEDWQKSK
ncbi:MAG: hypothetical protein SWX82_10170 [Cyanobacteriota bacterium]|nr:hypothetical protein [Cyanobacteriota bacterium]